VFSHGWNHPKSAALHQIWKSIRHDTGSKEEDGIKQNGQTAWDTPQTSSVGAFKGLKRRWLEDHSKEKQVLVVTMGVQDPPQDVSKLKEPLKTETKRDKLSRKEKRRALIMEDEEIQVTSGSGLNFVTVVEAKDLCWDYPGAYLSRALYITSCIIWVLISC
jgi:hypothetical protein